MGDVARRAGVSRQLASLVLREERGPSEASRTKVKRAATEIGFHPHASARLLRQNRTMLIGVVFMVRNEFQSTFVEHLFSPLRRHGYRLALAPVAHGRDADLAISELMEQRVEGLIAFNPPPDSTALRSAFDQLPVVWLGERDPSGRSDNVHVDERAGLVQVVGHLKALGHRRISYSGGLQGIAGPDRLAAYVAAMRAGGLAEHVDVLEGGFEEEDGARAARTLLERPAPRPTALVCSSDQSAAAALTVLARAGVAVPDDVSVVGFDDSRVAALSCNDLTSVRQDVTASVEATTELLVARLSGDRSPPRDVLVAATLTHRSSVAAAAPLGDVSSP